MKRFAISAAVAVMSFCATARTVTMMTYNVQIGAGLNDPYNFPKGGLGHLPQVAAHIREVNPDWVAYRRSTATSDAPDSSIRRKNSRRCAA